MADVYGSVYTKPNTFGDFKWMLAQPQFKNALFLFNDNLEAFYSTSPSVRCSAGGGNASIRPFQCTTPKRAMGIPTGSMISGGFASLNQVTSPFKGTAKDAIDIAITNIRGYLKSNPSITSVWYSATPNGQLGTGIFSVNPAVAGYITSQIRSLGNYKGTFQSLPSSYMHPKGVAVTAPKVTKVHSPVSHQQHHRRRHQSASTSCDKDWWCPQSVMLGLLTFMILIVFVAIAIEFYSKSSK